jgi:hypothetical protein
MASSCKSAECTICLENIDLKTKKNRILSCKHVFHNNCIYEWSVIENSCPICRKVFDFDTNNQKDFLDWMDLKFENFNEKYSNSKQQLIKFIEIIDTTIRLSEKGIECPKSIYEIMLEKLIEYKTFLNFSIFTWLCNKCFFGNELVCEYGWYEKRVKQLRSLISSD